VTSIPKILAIDRYISILSNPQGVILELQD